MCGLFLWTDFSLDYRSHSLASSQQEIHRFFGLLISFPLLGKWDKRLISLTQSEIKLVWSRPEATVLLEGSWNSSTRNLTTVFAFQHCPTSCSSIATRMEKRSLGDGTTLKWQVFEAAKLHYPKISSFPRLAPASACSAKFHLREISGGEDGLCFAVSFRFQSNRPAHRFLTSVAGSSSASSRPTLSPALPPVNLRSWLTHGMKHPGSLAHPERTHSSGV